GLAGCLSPTLPLPPPAKPDIEQVGTGEYRFTGTVPTAGFVYILNKRTESGGLDITTESNKAYDITLSAAPNDPMQIWYQAGDAVSDIQPFETPEGLPPPPPDAGTPVP